jgi:hypothetical protein
MRLQRPPEAISYWSRGMEIVSGLRVAQPGNEGLKILEAQGLAQHAFWLLKDGRVEEADSAYTRLSTLVEEAVALDTPYANSTRDTHQRWLRDTVAMRDVLKQQAASR